MHDGDVMEKEIFWSKDSESVGGSESRAPTVPSSSSRYLVAVNYSSVKSQSEKTSSKPIVETPTNLRVIQPAPALRTSSPINETPATARTCRRRAQSPQRVAAVVNSAPKESVNSARNTTKKAAVKQMSSTTTNPPQASSENSGASFKSLRPEDKQKLASLIQELATLTEEHDLLKSSLDRHAESHELEKVAFQKETKKLYQERERLLQAQEHLQHKLKGAIEELESLRGRETSRSSVCLQTSPRISGREQQTNAPALNTSLTSQGSRGSQGSHGKREEKAKSERSEVSVQTETGETTEHKAVHVPPLQLGGSETKGAFSDVGLQPVEVLSRTEDCYSIGESTHKSASDLNQLSTIERETIALKKKIIEQEKLLELKRKQIELQHEIHNQEVSAFNANKSAREDNVRKWIEGLPTSPSNVPEINGPKVTFCDVAETEGDGKRSRSRSTSKNRLHTSSGNLKLDSKINAQKSRSRSNSQSRAKSPSVSNSKGIVGKEAFETRKDGRSGPSKRSELLSSSSDSLYDGKVPTPLPNAKTSSSDSDGKPRTSHHGRAGRPPKRGGRSNFDDSVKAKVDSHYKPLREELELLPNETTDDLLLEAAGKLMHCRKLMDRSEDKIDHYQYTQYLEAMERRKLDQAVPVDNQFERKWRREVASKRGSQLIKRTQPHQSPHATEFLQPFFKLVDYMDDKVDSPTKYNTAALENIANFAREFSPESDARLRNAKSSSAYNAKLAASGFNRNRSSSLGRRSQSRSLSRDSTRNRLMGARKPVVSSAKMKTSAVNKSGFNSQLRSSNSKRNTRRRNDANNSVLTSELDSDENDLFDQVFFVK